MAGCRKKDARSNLPYHLLKFSMQSNDPKTNKQIRSSNFRNFITHLQDTNRNGPLLRRPKNTNDEKNLFRKIQTEFLGQLLSYFF